MSYKEKIINMVMSPLYLLIAMLDITIEYFIYKKNIKQHKEKEG